MRKSSHEAVNNERVNRLALSCFFKLECRSELGGKLSTTSQEMREEEKGGGRRAGERKNMWKIKEGGEGWLGRGKTALLAL